MKCFEWFQDLLVIIIANYDLIYICLRSSLLFIAVRLNHRIGKEQKAHSFDLFDAAATRRNARAPTVAMLLARSSQPE